ncbi:Acetolactate synthase-like protein [Hondaea fermentalgiana]|uniref:Acetolactate synthase-like protein n=1 Tax=Hondaea fermentalgiana TaxID=2315210 RepID=A0A2R5GJF3_9STRA|nr:Acetolactate synthase-like protein [Hondaea fermentalgiana]|eukprot:GBG28421.1 Acetolactate synthase-like protein [Hondaea fermentalgiana]
MSSSARRVATLRAHLATASQQEQEGKPLSQGVSPEETRSVSSLARDAWSIATENVALTERHGGDLVAEVLKAHKVDFIFCLSGGHISPFLVSCKRDGIRVVDVRHEVNAVFAADAVSRLSGRPGVAAVTAGPGVTNTVTAVKNAAMAQSPLVLLGGAAATLTQGRGALQDIDHLSFLRPICKWVGSARTVRDIVPLLRRAFQEAMSGVPGPVFLELPLDVLYPVLELLPQCGSHDRVRARDVKPADFSRLLIPREAKSQGMDAKAFLASRNPDAPVFLEVPEERAPPFAKKAFFGLLQAQLHAGAHDRNYDFSPLPITYPKPSVSDVRKVADRLRNAKRPVFVLQSQCMLHGLEGANRLAATLERLGVPCYLGGMTRGLLGRNSSLHIRQNRGRSLQEADLVCLFGLSVDFRLGYGQALPKRGVVHVNRAQHELELNTDLFWKPEVSALADPTEFIEALAKELGDKNMPRARIGEWTDTLRQRDAKKEAANAAKAAAPALGRNAKNGQPLINPLQLFHDLDDVLGDDAILVADGGDFVATGSYVLHPPGPLTWLDPGAFGTLGVGGGFALGAALLYPEKDIWIIWGDGSAGYSLLEFDTFNRHNLNVIALVGNDACWTQIEREQVPMFNDDVSTILDYIDYDKAAEGLGGRGLRIDTPDADVKSILREAQRISRQDNKPVLINAHIGRTDFREGSLSV